MSGYIAAKIENDRILEAWGPFPTPQAALAHLEGIDPRLAPDMWDQVGADWLMVVEDGDLEIAHFQVRALGEPAG